MNSRFIFFLFFISMIPIGVLPQTDKRKNIISKVYIQNGSNYIETVQYYNNFGEPTAMVKKQITPKRKDLTTLTTYNGLGEVSKKYLPMPKESEDVYNSDPRNFFEIKIEPFGIKTISPGTPWENHPITTEYQTNTGNQVRYFTADADNQLVSFFFYPENSLYKTVTTDEDGKNTATYTDKLGRTVMKQQENHKTYYVYNDLGQQIYVLPPLANSAVGIRGSINETNPAIQKYAYVYKYDEQGNCTYKKLPGCEPIYMVYDKADRLILSQDGNQRRKSPVQWTITKYDTFGRVLYTGVINRDITDTEKEIVHNNVIIEEKGKTHQLTNTGYTCNTFIEEVVPLTVYYYDTYHFLPENNPLQYQQKQGYSKQHSSAKGLLTGTRTYMLDESGAYTVTALYYDNKGNVVQSRATNHLGGYDIVYNDIDFTGKPNKTLKEHNIAEQATRYERYGYNYDHAGRLSTTTTYDYNGKPILLSENTYDELGRLTKKVRHNGQNMEQYEYNIRNWTTKIKSGTFEEELYYQKKMPNNNQTTPCYNGNISAIRWKYQDKWNGYRYYYDNLNRYIAGISFSSVNAENGNFCEYFTYDAMGNVTEFERSTPNAARTDYAKVSYNGNQIIKITDNGISQNQYHIKEYTDQNDASNPQTPPEMLYDANGNLTTDLDRNIVTIRYNLLNLPDTIQFGTGGNQIINRYNAAGQKLSTEYVLSNSTTSIPIGQIDKTARTASDHWFGNHYIDNKEYRFDSANGDNYVLDKAYNPEGYLYYRHITPRFYYYAKDHLGNIREVWRPTVEETYYAAGVVQRTQYYPSGLPWAEGLNPGVQNKKYNGKEWVEAHGLDEYDSEARWYYPAIMRTTTIDPLAEKYPNVSPYAYCLNNPLIWTDPTGMTVEPGSQKEWDKQKQSVTAERDRLQGKIDRLNAKASEKGWSAEKLSRKIGNMQERVNGLNGAISNLGVLEASTQVYSLNSGAAQNEVSYDASTGNIVISYSGTALFTHETTHAGQFETGDIAFNTTNGATLGQDVYDEVAGYKAQWAYDPSSVGGLNSASQITTTWVQGVTDPVTGNQPYKPGGTANTGISPVNVNSTRDDLIKAYPHQKSVLQTLPASATLKSVIPTIYTKTK